MKKFLMCEPDFFSVEYEINPWMHVENRVEKKLAQKQWQTLYDICISLGAEIELIEPVEGLPDMVFTANEGLVYKNKFVLSNFRCPERQGESERFKRWFSANGYQIIELDKNFKFEGEGEALFTENTLFAAYGFRSDLESHKLIAEKLNIEVISLRLVNPKFYHLDTCLCPFSNKIVMYYPGAFDEESAEKIESTAIQTIRVSEKAALSFICNAVPIDNKFITNSNDAEIEEELKNIGYQYLHVNLTEFKKSGGGTRCLMLEI